MNYPFPPYQDAYVYTGPSESFVAVPCYDRDQAKYIREKVRLNIRGLDRKKKRTLLIALCSKINDVIKVRNQQGLYHYENYLPLISKYSDASIPEVYEVFYADKDNPKTQKDLAHNFIGKFRKFCEGYPGMLKATISAIPERVIKSYIEFLQEEEELTGKTINNHLWILDQMMARVKKGAGAVMAADPSTLRVAQPKNETERYKPLSFKQKENIFSFFGLHQNDFYQNYNRYLLFMYYTCFRPAEIMRLQLEYFDLEQRTIYVPWYKSKNGLSKYVQILEPLYLLLKSLRFEKYPGKYFLFSHRFDIGADKKSAHNNSLLWGEACDKLNIEDRQSYGLKGTFNRDYVENNKKNVDWEWLRRHNRHATIQQTQDYISGLTAYFLDETEHTILDHTRLSF